MSQILLGKYKETPKSIAMETAFSKTPIANEQYFQSFDFEEKNALLLESRFNSKFQGYVSPIYNCHGMTFANRRTGIYDEQALRLILEEEHVQIKSLKDVIVGDVVVYYLDDDTIIHSAIVVVCDFSGLLPQIKVLGKVPKYKEIVHNYSDSPYNTNIKFYRSNHERYIKLVKGE